MSNQQLVMHIGANKTGSSAIQHFLRINRTEFAGLGYVIPDKNLGLSDQVTGEHVFAYQRLMDAADPKLIETRTREMLSGVSRGNILVSAENLSNNANFAFFGSFLKSLDCKVILYIRRQDELLTSSWQQWHSKRQSDLDSWLFSAIKKLGHWQHCIEGWERAVGQGNVIVRVFQKSDLVNGDVIDDFMSALGLASEISKFKRPAGVINPSYSDLITPIVSKNPFLFETDHDNNFYRFVEEMTGDYYVKQKKVSLIGKEQRDNIIAFYKEENLSVAKKYFVNRTDLFEKVDHFKYDYLDSAELVRRQLGFVTSLLYAMWKKGR